MQVREYVGRRLFKLPLIMIAMSILIFGISRIGASPIGIYLEHEMTPAEVVELEERFNLNDSLPEQYWAWATGVVRGDLGWSGVSTAPVSDVLWKFTAASMELALVAAAFGIVAGIGLGTYAGSRRDKPGDHITRIIAISGASLPLFWLALLVLIFFYVILGWAPTGRYDVNTWETISHPTGFYTVDALLNGSWTAFGDALSHLWLPALVLAYGAMGPIARIMRSSLVDELEKDYVDAARAKGLPERLVIGRHARRNAMIPTVTVIGHAFGHLLQGSVVIELIFQWPGIGRWIATAVLRGDQATILAFVLITSVIFLTVNLIVDVLYAYLDRRVELGT